MSWTKGETIYQIKSSVLLSFYHSHVINGPTSEQDFTTVNDREEYLNIINELKRKHNMNTRSESLAKTIPTSSALHGKIRDVLRGEPALSRREIADRTGLSLQSVCARISELKKSGEVKEVGTKYDSDTDRNVKLLSLV